MTTDTRNPSDERGNVVADPITRAIDSMFAFETPATRWLRLASEQLRKSEMSDAE